MRDGCLRGDRPGRGGGHEGENPAAVADGRFDRGVYGLGHPVVAAARHQAGYRHTRKPARAAHGRARGVGKRASGAVRLPRGPAGARVMFTASFVLLLAPVWLISSATTWQELLVGGVFLGLGGAVFSIGVTSLPAYYPQERHGFVNGVYGFGNVGTALTTWLAPVAAAAFGLACGRATLPHTAGRIRRAELCTGRPQRTACEDAHYEPVARHLAR